jgi:hypothetical protein
MRITMERNRPTMSVPEAGKKYFGLGRNASYAAAARGDFPTMWIGSRVFAIVAALERKIEEAGLIGSGPTSRPKRETMNSDEGSECSIERAGLTVSDSTSQPKPDGMAANARFERS